VPSADLDRLFAGPLKTFVAERKRLADQAKAAGQAQQAKEILKIPRPSVPAWVVNQLARQEAPLLQRLAEVTGRLRDAQRQVARGPSGAARLTDHAEALAAHREVTKQLRARAEEILRAAGQAAGHQLLERALRNLRVGLASEESRRIIQSGRLVHDLAEQDLASLLGPSPGDGEAAHDAPAKRAGEPTAAGGGPPHAASRQAEAGAPARTAARTTRKAHERPEPATTAREAEQARVRRAHERTAREAAAREAEQARARARAEAEQARAAERARARARAELERRIKVLRAEADGARRAQEREERSMETARAALADAEARLQQARLASERAAGELSAAEAARHDHR
jgi:hypothetical protein